MSRQDHDVGPPEQRFYVAKLKMGLLIPPCLLGVAAALQADDAVEFAFADYRWINAAAVLICLFVAFLLFRMAMEKEPRSSLTKPVFVAGGRQSAASPGWQSSGLAWARQRSCAGS